MIVPRLRYIARQAREIAFDRRHGVSTRGWMEMPGFAGAGDDLRRDAGPYYPSPIPMLRHMIRKSKVDPANFTFVDLGCGRGRALLIASQFAFRAVIGIEADRALRESAERNAATWLARRKASPISVAHADARHFEFPPGNLFIYLYNPFTGAVFETVAGRLAELAREPGRLVVIAYATHVEAARLEATGAFTRKLLRPRRIWAKPSVSFFYNDAAAQALGIALKAD